MQQCLKAKCATSWFKAQAPVNNSAGAESQEHIHMPDVGVCGQGVFLVVAMEDASLTKAANGTESTTDGAILALVDDRAAFWLLVMLSEYLATLAIDTVLMTQGPKACQSFRRRRNRREPLLVGVPATLHEQPQEVSPDGIGTEGVDIHMPARTADTTVRSSRTQKRAVQAAFLVTATICLTATGLSVAYGHLSKQTGLSWEGYAALCSLACAWQLAQACVATVQLQDQRCYGIGAFAEGAVNGMLPFISDSFDTLKDSLFGGLCLQSPYAVTQALGVISWIYLLAFHLVLLRRGRFLAELGRNYLGVWLAPTKAQANSDSRSSVISEDAPENGRWGRCSKAAFDTLLPLLYAQITPTKRLLLIIENAPQALMAIAYLALEGGSILVACLNLAIPLCQILASFVLCPLLRPVVGPWYAAKLDAAVADDNRLVIRRLILEAGARRCKFRLDLFVLCLGESSSLS